MQNQATTLGATGAEEEGAVASAREVRTLRSSEAATVRGTVWAVAVGDGPDHARAVNGRAYRWFEILVALTGLILGAPLVLAACVIIRAETPGSPFFVHRRPGRFTVARGRDLRLRTDVRAPPGGFDADALYYVPTYFNLIKLRTMYKDSRARFPDLYSYDYTADAFYSAFPTMKDDPRVTTAGRILRKLSIDEIPNLLSVLKGDLSLVGPRPEAPEVLKYYSQEEMYKFSCKPGITGLAQVNGRGLLNWKETIFWDLRYVREQSVALNLKILLWTLVRVGTRHGAF